MSQREDQAKELFSALYEVVSHTILIFQDAQRELGEFAERLESGENVTSVLFSEEEGVHEVIVGLTENLSSETKALYRFLVAIGELSEDNDDG